MCPREVLAGETVEVLVCAALPGAGTFGEVDLDAGGGGEFLVASYLHASESQVRVRFICAGNGANAAITALLALSAV